MCWCGSRGGHPGAAQRLNQISPWRISVVTYIELAQGCRDKTDLARLKKGLAAHETQVLPITPAISQCAADSIEALALSHGLRLADALIGATALEHDLTLLTANVKCPSIDRRDLSAAVPRLAPGPSPRRPAADRV